MCWLGCTSVIRNGWVNIYLWDFYSPKSYNRCAGVIYPELKSALEAIDSIKGYVATIEISWPDVYDLIRINR